MMIGKCQGLSFGANLVIDEKLKDNKLVSRVKNRLVATGGDDVAYKIYQTKSGDLNFVAHYLPNDSFVITSCQVENKASKFIATQIKKWANKVPQHALNETNRLAKQFV